MQLTKKEEAIIRLITPYMMAFPHSKANEGTLLVYARSLSALDIPEIEAALNKLMLTAKFFPTIAEIYEQIGEVRQYIDSKENGRNSLTSAEAWEEVMRHVKDYGIYKKWNFSTPEVERAAKQFGIQELCYLEMKDVNTARAQFMRIYDSVSKRKKNDKFNAIAINMLPPDRANQLLKIVNIKMIE